VGLGNYYYTKYFFGFPGGGIKGVLLFQLYTLVIGIFPVTFLTLLNYNRHLKKNLVMAGNVKKDILSHKTDHVKQIDDKVTIPSSSKNEEFRVMLNHLYYLQSEGNYIRVCFSKDGNIELKLVRSTMKTAERKLSGSFPPLIRSHRSYIINSDLIDDVSGNSQGLLLTLKGLDEKVPVSRGYVDKVRSILS
jgi:DNA-binding LytR/AlgR family response regulator